MTGSPDQRFVLIKSRKSRGAITKFFAMYPGPPKEVWIKSYSQLTHQYIRLREENERFACDTRALIIHGLNKWHTQNGPSGGKKKGSRNKVTIMRLEAMTQAAEKNR
jgi:hypothetical protein